VAEPESTASARLVRAIFDRIAPGFPDGAHVLILVAADGTLSSGGNTSVSLSLHMLEHCLNAMRRDDG
jgi:hypothetical protein